MMCKIKSCAGLHLFKAAILCSQRNYLNDIDLLRPRDWEWGEGWVGSGRVLCVGTRVPLGSCRAGVWSGGGRRLSLGGPLSWKPAQGQIKPLVLSQVSG